MSPREIRFRRLLALYPGDFRAEYGDEMLGVLLSDSRPVRRQAGSLVVGAVTAHLRPIFGGSAWRPAARAVQLFGAILLTAIALRRVVPVIVGSFTLGFPLHLDGLDLIRVIAWGAVVVAAFTGARGLAVASALAGLGGEIAAPARYYFDTPAIIVNMFWLIVAATVVLTASIAARDGGRPRGCLVIAVAGLALILQSFSAQVLFTLWGSDGYLVPGYRLSVDRALLAVPAALVVVAIVRLDAATVRRRVLTCGVPVLAVFPVDQTFAGFKEHNGLHPEDLWLLSPLQWAALGLIPVVAFLIASAVVRRWERAVSRKPVAEN